MLPRSDLETDQPPNQILNHHQSYSSTRKLLGNNVKFEKSNANAVLTLDNFDGMSFADSDKTWWIVFQSEEKLKIQMENTLQELITEYFTIVQQKQLLKPANDRNKFCRKKEWIAKAKIS